MSFDILSDQKCSPELRRLTDVATGWISTADVTQWAVVVVVALIDTVVAPVLIIGTGWPAVHMADTGFGESVIVMVLVAGGVRFWLIAGIVMICGSKKDVLVRRASSCEFSYRHNQHRRPRQPGPKQR